MLLSRSSVSFLTELSGSSVYLCDVRVEMPINRRERRELQRTLTSQSRRERKLSLRKSDYFAGSV